SLTYPMLSPGTHTISARVTDASGLAAEAHITVVVAHPPVVGIAAPPDGSVYYLTDLPVSFSGQASDFEDVDLTARIQWRSDLAGPLGTGAAISAAGLAIGRHTITATVTDSDGLTGEAEITIRVRGPNASPQLTITAPHDGAAAPAGTTVQLAAAATDDFDGDISSRVRWTSDRDGALFTGASRALLLSEGSHVLTASVADTDGASASAQVHVTITPTAPVVTITAPPVGTRVFAGTNIPFTATAIDATDGDVGATLRWNSNLDGPIGTGPAFSTSRLSAGTHTVTATANDTGGLLGRVPATLAFSPVADTYVDSGAATKVLGTATTMQAASSPVRQAFLRFQVNGVAPLKVQQALVRLTVGSSSTDASAVGGTLRTITNGTWSEATTTYNTRPAVDGAVLSTKGKVLTKQVVDFDA